MYTIAFECKNMDTDLNYEIDRFIRKLNDSTSKDCEISYDHKWWTFVKTSSPETISLIASFLKFLKLKYITDYVNDKRFQWKAFEVITYILKTNPDEPYYKLDLISNPYEKSIKQWIEEKYINV